MALGKLKPGKIAWKSDMKNSAGILSARNARRLEKKAKKKK